MIITVISRVFNILAPHVYFIFYFRDIRHKKQNIKDLLSRKRKPANVRTILPKTKAMKQKIGTQHIAMVTSIKRVAIGWSMANCFEVCIFLSIARYSHPPLRRPTKCSIPASDPSPFILMIMVEFLDDKIFNIFLHGNQINTQVSTVHLIWKKLHLDKAQTLED